MSCFMNKYFIGGIYILGVLLYIRVVTPARAHNTPG